MSRRGPSWISPRIKRRTTRRPVDELRALRDARDRVLFIIILVSFILGGLLWL